jgi:hypothetical protein
MVRLAVNEFDTILSQIHRGDEQWLVIRALGASRQIIEDGVNRRSNFRIAGQQAEIGVEVRGRRVVVACPQMRVLPHFPVRVSPGK